MFVVIPFFYNRREVMKRVAHEALLCHEDSAGGAIPFSCLVHLPAP